MFACGPRDRRFESSSHCCESHIRHAFCDVGPHWTSNSWKQQPFAVFLDLSWAFDTVNHDILLENRSQYVNFLETKSDTLFLSRGVPPDSILGPLLFLIYMNDFNLLLNISNSYVMLMILHYIFFFVFRIKEN